MYVYVRISVSLISSDRMQNIKTAFITLCVILPPISRPGRSVSRQMIAFRSLLHNFNHRVMRYVTEEVRECMLLSLSVFDSLIFNDSSCY